VLSGLSGVSTNKRLSKFIGILFLPVADVAVDADDENIWATVYFHENCLLEKQITQERPACLFWILKTLDNDRQAQRETTCFSFSLWGVYE